MMQNLWLLTCTRDFSQSSIIFRIYCKRTKSEIPEFAERGAGVDIGSLIIRKIAEFAKPVDLAEKHRLRSTHELNRAPQATIKRPSET
jgi:hypothetical protein